MSKKLLPCFLGKILALAKEHIKAAAAALTKTLGLDKSKQGFHKNHFQNISSV